MTIRYGRVVHDTEIEEAPDQKYVVFNRDELYRMLEELGYEGALGFFETAALYDAVVIRTRDQIAGPVLHIYSDSVGLAAALLRDVDTSQSARLFEIADYIHGRALEADEAESHLPD